MIGKMLPSINKYAFIHQLLIQLVPLPRKPTVSEILKAYSTTDKANRPSRPGSAEADIFEEVISGIKLYFDRCLGNILLYRFERQQYVDVRRSSEGKEMSDIYGAEHLLRLFGIVPYRPCTHLRSVIARFDCTYEHGSTEHPDIKRSH